jgi:hypothetical protein
MGILREQPKQCFWGYKEIRGDRLATHGAPHLKKIAYLAREWASPLALPRSWPKTVSANCVFRLSISRRIMPWHPRWEDEWISWSSYNTVTHIYRVMQNEGDESNSDQNWVTLLIVTYQHLWSGKLKISRRQLYNNIISSNHFWNCNSKKYILTQFLRSENLHEIVIFNNFDKIPLLKVPPM